MNVKEPVTEPQVSEEGNDGGDDRSPLIWLLLLGLGGGMAGAAWFLWKKGKEDQNQD